MIFSGRFGPWPSWAKWAFLWPEELFWGLGWVGFGTGPAAAAPDRFWAFF